MNADDYLFVADETGPAEIKDLPVVSGKIIGERGFQSGEVDVFRVDKGYYPGQIKIREEAAMLANENNVSATWAELGVETGRSAYFLSQYLPANGRFFLFDSFQGLPENWALSQQSISPKGKFACEVPVFKDERLVVVPGWFEDTLPHAEMSGPLGLIHIDSDLYSSCKTALERLDEQIVPGTVILFDEFWGYPNWREGEYKALTEWHREFRYVVRDTKFRVVIECV